MIHPSLRSAAFLIGRLPELCIEEIERRVDDAYVMRRAGGDSVVIVDNVFDLQDMDERAAWITHLEAMSPAEMLRKAIDDLNVPNSGYISGVKVSGPIDMHVDFGKNLKIGAGDLVALHFDEQQCIVRLNNHRFLGIDWYPEEYRFAARTNYVQELDMEGDVEPEVSLKPSTPIAIVKSSWWRRLGYAIIRRMVRTTCYYEYRADGWPLCPQCGEDELWSAAVPADPLGELRCYRCLWSGRVPLADAYRAEGRASVGKEKSEDS